MDIDKIKKTAIKLQLETGGSWTTREIELLVEILDELFGVDVGGDEYKKLCSELGCE